MILEDEALIARLVREAQRVAVVGIKPEEQAGQPAHYVPKSIQAHGAKIIPVPVYYPDVETILGEKCVRRLTEIDGPIDIVDVFRKSVDVPQHLDELLAKKPRAVWMQLGIRNDEVAERLSDAGIDVVQNRCLMVDWRRFRSA